MAITKIWFKGPDSTRQCCGCAGKTGPCSTCCSGLMYNLTTTGWIGSPFLFAPLPAASCTVAQNPFDTYSQSGTVIMLEIIGSGNHSTDAEIREGRIRQNGISTSVRSGDVIMVEMTSTVSTTGLIAEYLSFEAPTGFALAFNYQYGNTFGLHNESNIDQEYGVSLFSDFPSFGGGFDAGSIIDLAQTGANNYIFNNYVLYTGVYNIVVGTQSYPTGSPAPLFLGPPDSPQVPSQVGDVSGDSIGMISDSFDVDTQTCWSCVANPFFNWLPTGSTGNNDVGRLFGQTQEEADIWNASVLSYISNSAALAFPNRGLGFSIDPSSGTAVDDGFFGGPDSLGIPCDIGNIGQQLCYDGFWTVKDFYITNWPRLSTTLTPITNRVEFQITSGVCLDILPGNGGQSFVFPAYPTGGLFFDSYWSQSGHMTITSSSPLVLNPIGYYTGAGSIHTRVPCPFALP